MCDNEQIATYLGQKGYSIYKENISVDEQHWMRNELTVRPFVPKSPVPAPSFPIYLESQQKLYVPRFFGIDTYGEPDEERISKGDPIKLVFNGELRDYQNKIVIKFKPIIVFPNPHGTSIKPPPIKGFLVICFINLLTIFS